MNIVSWFPFLKGFFHFVLCIWVFCLCASPCPAFVQCLWRQGRVTDAPGITHGWEVAENQTLEEHQALLTHDPSLYLPDTSWSSTISECSSIVGWNFNMSFRGGKLYLKHSSSSLYSLWLHLLSEHGKHHACLHSLSPLPSPPRPHIKSCWQKLVGRIRSSLRTRVECLRWCSAKIKTVII